MPILNQMRALQTGFLLVAVIQSVAAQATEDLTIKADAYINAAGFRGCILLAKGGKVILAKGYGLANVELDVANRPDTKFRLGSITKQFTAAAILQLQERGKLKVSEAKNSSMGDYRQWQESRAAVIARGSEPSYEVFLATDARPIPEGAAEIQVETLSTEREIGRPTGARFGTLVHNILRDVALDADEDAIARAAKLHGRLTGALRLETSAAQLAVQRVLTHPMLSRARASASHHREWPLRVQIGEVLFEGIIDLAFLEDELWHVVDFKTDVYDPARKRRYEGQLRWYVLALERITGKPGRAYLLSA